MKWFLKDLLKAISWLRFGFKDQDWDWAYSYKVLEYKTDRMVREFSKCKFHDHSTDIKELKEFSALCKLLSTDSEFDYAFEISHAKWGEYEKKTGKLAKELGDIAYAPRLVRTKRSYEKYRAEFDKLLQEGKKRRNMAFSRFVELLKTRSDSWSC